LSLFLLLLAAHVCGDIVVNSDFLAKNKRSENQVARTGALVVHCVIHFGFVWLWLWPFGRTLKIWASLYVFVVHFLIDYCRTYAEAKLFPGGELMALKKKQVLEYLLGRRDKDVAAFFGKHLKTWVWVNLIDQGMHVAAIGLFVMVGAWWTVPSA